MILQHRLKGSPDSSGIQVLKNYGDLPLIECYPSHLNQVFMNILVNAIDALEEMAQQTSPSTKDRIKKIIISTAITDAKQAEIRILDNGSGIN